MTVRIAPEGRAFLNVGCGDTYFQEWNNCDLLPGRDVVPHDLRRPLPYAAGVFDAVYCSHVLEHLNPGDGAALLREMFRVLKPGGVCRLVVPDLEAICRLYLQYLDEAALDSAPEKIRRYDWMVLELLDQMVRETRGGLMRQALDRGEFDEALARNRVGDHFDKIRPGSEPIRLKSNRSDIPGGADRLDEGVGNRLRRRWARLRLWFTSRSNDPRSTGETHRWMYDRLSLTRVMAKAGFARCSVKSFDESDIPHWDKYNLDVSKYGQRPRKPDSLYVEGTRPEVQP